MKRKQLRFGKGFHLAITGSRAQAATMVIEPGSSEGDKDNYHRGSDQWLLVVAGNGKAVVNGKSYPLRPGTLLLIERGDKHEICATGDENLQTFNLYNPPAYQTEDDPRSAGKPGG